MPTGAITDYIDVAQLVLYAFWIFFAVLVIYLRREDKREGYPLEAEPGAPRRRGLIQGFPATPPPKSFLLVGGETIFVPRREKDAAPIAATPAGAWPGAPLEPTGDPMRDAVGPAAYPLRSPHPERSLDGLPTIVPLRLAPEMFIVGRDPDPRGMRVIGGDRRIAGEVVDVWVDRGEPQIRYFEVAVAAAPGRTVLLPIGFARIDAYRRQITVRALLADQFAHVPPLAHPEQVSLAEEDRITAYYAGGTLYATPKRLGPWL